MDMASAIQTFMEESAELLQELEQHLLSIEPDEQPDKSALNAMFRAAHTIKGSAGLFGYDAIVSFTHWLENLLDKLRAGELRFSAELVTLLLACSDHIKALLESIEQPQADHQLQGLALLQQLQSYLQPTSLESRTSDWNSVTSEPSTTELKHQLWHLSLRFGPDILRNGMDPLSFLRYLGSFGQIRYLACIDDQLPELSRFDPECCYLGFELDFESNASKQQIEEVFEFIREDSRIRILPPHSKLAEYIQLINSLPEDPQKLGQILIQGGALTAAELDEVLGIQRHEQQASKSARPLGHILVDETIVPAQVVNAALKKQKQTEERKNQETRFIKVDAQRMDHLINLVGELVIAGASATLLAARSHQPALVEATSVISSLVEQIRDGALSMRMVPIGEIFGRFPRVVRDVSLELGKEIRLDISGADTELDKSMIEKLGDPLLHTVRNAIDHGIEAPDVRQAAGKPATGTLQLHAYHESGSIVIEVSDDGGGLNRQRILNKAIERGLVSHDAQLTDSEICQLIFEPGFSTAESITNLSGRGVGMDVVKRNIEQLRGDIELKSIEGAGTQVRIRLPLTLAIIDGFQVSLGKRHFVLPLALVIECLELDNTHNDQQYINLRGEVLPCISLRELFHLPKDTHLKRQNIVVVQYGHNRAGLIVDQLQGELQAVIKPLGQLFKAVQGLGGSTILGSGEVALILDVPQLIQLAERHERQQIGCSPNESAADLDSL